MIVVSLLLILVAVTLLVLGLIGGSSSLLISSIVASLLAAVALVIGARQASAARRAATLRAGAATRPARHPATDSFPEPDPYAEDDLDRAAAHAAGRQDTEAFLTGPAATQRVHPGADLDDDAAAAGPASSGRTAGPAATTGSAPRAGETDDAPPRTAAGDTRSTSEDPSGQDQATATGEFQEPDPDDPDDEPLPQAVRPADAVQVARLDAEVLVVDGRPRYHLAGCTHLTDRETEGLPVAEAVELGFSPCGLCRPVDHLVAAATRH